MRKFIGFFMAATSLLGAVLGFFVRQVELNFVFHPTTGLAEPWAPQSLLTIFVSAGVVLLLLFLSLLTPKNKGLSYPQAFGNQSGASAILCLLGLGIAVFAAAGHFLEPQGQSPLGTPAFFENIWTIAAIVSGLCLAAMPWLSKMGRNVSLLAVAPVFWLCFWLIWAHVDYASNPVLLAYVYHLLALAFLLLSLYYIAGAAWSLLHPRRLLFCAHAAVYFTGISLADTLPFWQMLVFVCLGATALAYALLCSAFSGGALPVNETQSSPQEDWLIAKDSPPGEV